ncbi:hypothetical protein Cseg_1259 [Caulobacter segnis ATCC 21756]|uniref:Uncharacterized protein n=2 Tax=Caulobacter segnis TaxID=88688 RepID=D5VFM6_CAUST|nr:hypothetical protein Cseg_1259 [Caulobacter segnis ATCC 21756]
MLAERDSLKAMAKAQFKKNQRVWVDSVGAWATVERVVPAWVGGLPEPVRVTYDVGLGRMFHAFELTADPREAPAPPSQETWRVARGPNRWRGPDEAPRQPNPGTYPVVYTDPQDWGGWRVPRAEYDRDPERIEAQARMIAAAPKMRALIQDLITLVANGAATPEVLRGLARRAATLELEFRDMHGDEAVRMKATPAPPAEQPPTPAARPSSRPEYSTAREGFKSPSLSERMAALERELNLRPRASGVFAAAPRPAAPASKEPPESVPPTNFLRRHPK